MLTDFNARFSKKKLISTKLVLLLAGNAYQRPAANRGQFLFYLQTCYISFNLKNAMFNHCLFTRNIKLARKQFLVRVKIKQYYLLSTPKYNGPSYIRYNL